ncbi:MAG: deoxynucleoside kinase [Eubacteriaceae bacterium]|jgi:dTMP kinase|nr:deoxynucleoside kinase [Eubacteriaceae bacterium]
MKGKLFVVEGLDGSGKQTQSDMLFKRLLSEGFNVKKVSYPNYASEASSLVKMYLRGDFGENPEDVSAYISSTFFAADRYADYKTGYGRQYNEGAIIIADRYTTSNMVHQACKMEDIVQREEYLDWLCELEYKLYGIPEPNAVFFLNVDPRQSRRLMENRANKYTGQAEKDIHEKSLSHETASYANALWLAEKYGWEKIECMESGSMKSPEMIHEQLYHRLEKYL